MRCVSCGSENIEAAVVCASCGAPLLRGDCRAVMALLVSFYPASEFVAAIELFAPYIERYGRLPALST